jgi:16S rRNA processing protein RimM
MASFDSKTSGDAPQAWLRVALIARPQGHRGEVIAELLTDFPERFGGSPTVQLRAPNAENPARGVTVERYRLHQGRVVLKFAGLDTMNDAETLRGFEVVVPWEERVPLAEDEVYVAELVGCRLMDETTGAAVGTIVDVDRESSNMELLVVESASGAEVLVPFVRAYAPKLDMAARIVRMRLPDGLLDLDVKADVADTEEAG